MGVITVPTAYSQFHEFTPPSLPPFPIFQLAISAVQSGILLVISARQSKGIVAGS